VTFQAELFAHLQADAAVTALIGDRLYPVNAPTLDLTASVPNTVVYKLVGRRPDGATMDGKLIYISDEWELIAIAETYDQAHAIADALTASLNYIKGALGSGTKYVQASELIDAADDDDVLLGFFAVMLRFTIRYQ
jgi:hypothetical protein